MPRPKTLPETYDSCLADGQVKACQDIDEQKIRSLLENASTNIESAEILSKNLARDAKGWMNVYTLYYEALRICAEALLLLVNIKSNNHQCLFAALCIKYAALDLDWNFFERIRTKRNGVNYYGQQITFSDWKSIDVQMKLYIFTLREEIEKGIKTR